jgi:hypothetical protein
MALYIDDRVFENAATEMDGLKERIDKLHKMLEGMFDDLTHALATPAGKAVKWTGKDVLLQPVEDMSKIIRHMSEILREIIAINNAETDSSYYEIFAKYDELDKQLRNNTTTQGGI